MRTRDLFRTAVHDVAVNRSRTILTILGIVIGVGAVVLMTGIGRSMQGVILGQVSALGPQTIVAWPGQKGPEAGAGGAHADFDALTMSDVDALRSLSSLSGVAPIIFLTGDVSYGRETSTARVVGATPEYYGSQKIELSVGRFHDQTDEGGQRPVAVIGSDVVKDLFPNEDPLGKRVAVGADRYVVIGVLKPIGSQFFQNMDERIIVPFSTAKALTQRSYVDMVVAEATVNSNAAIAEVQNLLRARHHITLPADGGTGNDNFLVRSAEQAQQILGTVSLALTLFITLIAGISLVVGGIGIMNILLVSVTERTREIGLRKALGATQRDILLQFLAEAIVLTFLGGCVGLFMGLWLDYLIALLAGRFLASYVFSVSSTGMIVSLLMAVVTGLIFGIYPAKKAASLDPIESLRYE